MSQNPRRRASYREWQSRLRSASSMALPSPHFATVAPVAVVLYYLPIAEMQGDLDNVIKPILDALKAHIFVDDHQVERIIRARSRAKAVGICFCDATRGLECRAPIALRACVEHIRRRGRMMTRQSDVDLSAATPMDVDRLLDEAHTTSDAGHFTAAFLLAWSALEAVARRAFAPRLAKPQSAGSIIEMLAYGGFLSPSEADHVRPLASLRNRIVHGDLSARVDRDQVREFIALVQSVHLLEQSPEPADA